MKREELNFWSEAYDKASSLVLLHNAKDGRFAITDVTDAHYDEFLPAARDYFGKLITIILL